MKIRLKPIQEQVVVIVGASSGIGRQTALLFSKLGARLVLSARDQSELDSLAEEIRSQGGEATPMAADVSQFDQVKNLAETAVNTYGRIDTWVHAAAVNLYATFEETTPEEFKQVVDINLTGQAYGAMAALPYLRNEGRGALIHISSIDSKQALPFQAAYSASKHGITGFLESLRMELREEGIPISVTNIIPASVNTPLFDKAETKLGVKPQPIPPVYQPELVAEAILYAAENPVGTLYVGGSGRGVSFFRRMIPRGTEKALRKVGFEMQRSEEPKSSYAPNNLYKHMDGYDQVYGTFDDISRRRSVSTWMKTHPAARWGLALSTLAAAGVVSVIAFRSQVLPAIRSRRRRSRLERFERFLPGFLRPRSPQQRLVRFVRKMI